MFGSQSRPGMRGGIYGMSAYGADDMNSPDPAFQQAVQNAQQNMAASSAAFQQSSDSMFNKVAGIGVLGMIGTGLLLYFLFRKK